MCGEDTAPRLAGLGRGDVHGGTPRPVGRGTQSVARGAAAILDRLDRVRQTGPGRWIARCPAHDDHSPSLSIRALDDGRVLLHCFAGCGALDVLGAIGLEWSALYPPDERMHHVAPSHARIPARDLLVILDHELVVACLILADVLEQRTIDESQWDRLALAASRIGRARDHVIPAEVRHA
ncbi:MAG TPA: hypothetical protein VF193_01045 [Steroidobacter sp.]